MPLEVGPAFHESLDPPRTIRVPTLGAYVLVKGLSSRSRAHGLSRKAPKDIVYLLEILREPALAARVYEELAALAARWPDDYATWREWLDTVRRDDAMLLRVAEEAEESAGRPGASPAAAVAGLRDALGDLLRRTPRPARA